MRRRREQWQECVCWPAGWAENAYGMPMAYIFVTGCRHCWRGDGDRL